jgi:hypothetical protein
METTRRGFLAPTVAATGAAATHDLAHAAEDAHDHDHQAQSAASIPDFSAPIQVRSATR